LVGGAGRGHDALGPDADPHARAPGRPPAAAHDDPRAGIDGEGTIGRLGDLPGQEVHVPDEVGHERRQRPVVDRARLVELLDHAVGHDRDPVGHGQRLTLVMGDVDEGDPHLVLDALELYLHLLAELQVQRAQRLVQEQHPRIHHQRAGERDALLLAAGEHRGPVLLPAGHLHQLERFPRLGLALRLADLALLEPIGHVVQHGHMREQRVLLKDGVDLALVGRRADRVGATDQDLALVRLLEAGNQPQ
jgi:hypothetical protein